MCFTIVLVFLIGIIAATWLFGVPGLLVALGILLVLWIALSVIRHVIEAGNPLNRPW